MFSRYIMHTNDNPNMNEDLAYQKDVDNLYQEEKWAKRKKQPKKGKSSKIAAYFSQVSLEKVVVLQKFCK